MDSQSNSNTNSLQHNMQSENQPSHYSQGLFRLHSPHSDEVDFRGKPPFVRGDKADRPTSRHRLNGAAALSRN